MASQGSLNKVMLIGNVGTEIKAHYFDGGGSVANFTLATNESYVNKTTNQRVTNTEWHNIVVYNKLAEIFEKYVKVGDKIYVEGRLKTRKWQDESGRERYTTEVLVSEFTFLPRGEKSSSTNKTSEESKKQETSWKNNQPQDSSGLKQEEEDDLPF